MAIEDEASPVFQLRVVVFKGQKHWVAQCLEYDIAAQARQLDDLPTMLRKSLEAELELSRKEGVEPFSVLSPAPDRYWAMWKGSEPVRRARPWLDMSEELKSLIATMEMRTPAAQQL